MTKQQTVQYKKLVREIAEEMAAADFPGYAEHGDPVPEYIISLDSYARSARIAVRRMAEAVIIFAYGDIDTYKNIPEGRGSFDQELIERGLIPAKEDGNIVTE